MTTLEPVQPSPRQEAARALTELRAALDAHRIALPNLGLDGASLVAADASPDKRPLVELGRVNVATVLRLAYVLRVMEGR